MFTVLRLQVLAKLWVHPQLQQQMKNEGWHLDPNNPDLNDDPKDYEAASAPQTPTSSGRRYSDNNRNYPNESRREYPEDGWSNRAARNGSSTPVSEGTRSWADGMNQIPPPYTSDDDYSRGARSREDVRLDEMSRRSGSSRDGDAASDRVHKLTDHGGKDADAWV